MLRCDWDRATGSSWLWDAAASDWRRSQDKLVWPQPVFSELLVLVSFASCRWSTMFLAYAAWKSPIFSGEGKSGSSLDVFEQQLQSLAKAGFRIAAW